MNKIGRSRNARINQAAKRAYLIHKDIEALQGYTMNEYINEKLIWQQLRSNIVELNQCFHEANAYNNAMKE